MKKIMITAPVHQDAKIFREYLWSLDRLEIPKGYTVDKYFYLHNADNLKKFLQPNEYEIFKDNTKVEQSDITHIWKTENFSAVAQMRTKALERARQLQYDYIFSVDSDVILHKNNLIELLENNKDVISKTYWTVFDLNYPDLLLPNCYDYIDNAGKRVFINGLEEIKKEGIHKVGVTGACTLINKKIIEEPTINYLYIPIFSYSIWEDYSFCIKIKSMIPDSTIYTDNSNCPKHLYREEDYKKWLQEKKLWN